MSKALNLAVLTLVGIFTLSIISKPKNGVDVIGGSTPTSPDGFNPEDYQQGTISTDWVVVHSGTDRFGKLYEIYQRERTIWPSAREQYDYGRRPTVRGEWVCTENGNLPNGQRKYDSLESAMKAFNRKIGAVGLNQIDMASSANQLYQASLGNTTSAYGMGANTGGWGNSGR